MPFIPGPASADTAFPVDPFYLSWKAKEFDFRTRFIELAGEINVAMPYNVIAATVRRSNRRKKPSMDPKFWFWAWPTRKTSTTYASRPRSPSSNCCKKREPQVSYNDPYFPFVGRGRKYDLQMKCAPLDNLGQYDCVLIVTDHSDYDYKKIVNEAKLVVDSRNATKGIKSDKIVHC